MITMLREVRYAVRLIRRNKAFAIAVVVSTALGIGSTASIFSLVDAFLLRPLPVPETDRVIRLSSVTRSSAVGRFSYPDLDDILERMHSFDGLAAGRTAIFGLSRDRNEQPRVTLGLLINGDFFTTLRVRPALGRLITPADVRVPGRDPVVVLSYGTWQADFHGRRDIVGETVRLNGHDFAIVGVTPEWFHGIHPFVQPAAYVPQTMLREAAGMSDDVLRDRMSRLVDVFARLKPGVSLAQARDDLHRLGTDLEHEHPSTDKGRTLMAYSQLGFRIAEAPDNFALAWLFFAVGVLVLSIACINVANLLLSTAPSRLRETAIRLAMGASRARLLRQFLIESAVLAAGGTIAGLAIATESALLIRSIHVASALPVQLDARVDVRVVLFGFAIGMLSGVVAGVLPAVRATRADLNNVLRATELRFAPSRGWMRQGMVVAQVAAALVMMVLSGLFLESIQMSRRTDPGYRVDHVLTMGFDPRVGGYDARATRQFYRRLLNRMDAVPGVHDAALGAHIPLGISSSDTDLTVPGYQTGPTQSAITVSSSAVSDRYFDVLGIPILAGRAFTDRDREGAPPVAIVNEAMAQKYWPNRDAVGATIVIQATPPVTAQVVGVARTTKTRDIGETPQPFLYLPFEQRRDTPMTLFVQTAGDAAAMASVVRDAVRAVDPNQPIFDMRTLASHFEQQALFGIRLIAEVVAAVGIVGLVLSVLGLYAVIAYSVSQRTREIAVHMAVGASQQRVLAMVLRQGVTLTAIGSAIGLLLMLAQRGLTRDMLNGVNPRDPAIYALATAILAIVTLIATLVPARRASTIDPQAALRAE